MPEQSAGQGKKARHAVGAFFLQRDFVIWGLSGLGDQRFFADRLCQVDDAWLLLTIVNVKDCFAARLRRADASNFLSVATKSNQKVRLTPPAGVPSEKSRLNVSVALFKFSGGLSAFG